MQAISELIETINIDDPALDNISYGESNLLVHLWPGGLSYAIYNRVENQFLSLHELKLSKDEKYAEALEVFSNRPVFEKLFKEVRFTIDERIFTLVPRPLYDSKSVLQYLNLFEPNDREIIGKDTIAVADAMNIYSLPSTLVNKLKALFKAPAIVATSSVLLQHCLKEHRQRKDDLLFAHLQGTRLDVIALEKGRLVFYNRFSVYAQEDMSYFLLAVADQAAFNTDTVQVLLIGADSEVWLPTAQKYFENVAQGTRPRAFQYSAGMEALPAGAFYPLFSLNGCEL